MYPVQPKGGVATQPASENAWEVEPTGNASVSGTAAPRALAGWDNSLIQGLLAKISDVRTSGLIALMRPDRGAAFTANESYGQPYTDFSDEDDGSQIRLI